MNGVLVDTQLEKMIAAGQIRASDPIDPDQIQPNSIDLRVGRTAYRVRASFLPTRGTVQDKLIGGLSLAPELPRPRGSEDGEKPQTRRLEALDGIAPFDPTNVCLRRAGDLGSVETTRSAGPARAEPARVAQPFFNRRAASRAP